MKQLIQVIPDEWGPFGDIRACWNSRTRNNDVTRLCVPAAVHACVREADKDTLFVCWEAPWGVSDRQHRAYLVTAVYSEAFDPDRSKMLPQHRVHFDAFKELSTRLDGVFVHTPWMREQLASELACPVYVMPVGWDAEAMGAPRMFAPKHRLIGYHGSMTGRREQIVPMLARQYGANEWNDLTGRFGRELIGALDTTAVSLYIAHSLVQSFSTWRLWQCASTSCVLVAEPGDTWPFVADEHYIEIPRISIENIRETAERVLAIMHQPGLRLRALAAHYEVARNYNLRRIEQEFIRPAFADMRDRR